MNATTVLLLRYISRKQKAERSATSLLSVDVWARIPLAARGTAIAQESRVFL